MAIQSTHHPHSQGASSSLLTNEGGGMGEAGTEGDRHTVVGKETEKRQRGQKKVQCGAEADKERATGERERQEQTEGKGQR